MSAEVEPLAPLVTLPPAKILRPVPKVLVAEMVPKFASVPAEPNTITPSLLPAMRATVEPLAPLVTEPPAFRNTPFALVWAVARIVPRLLTLPPLESMTPSEKKVVGTELESEIEP